MIYILTLFKFNTMKKINAKFKSNCHETGKVISKGELMLYNYDTRKCYCMTSKKAQDWEDSRNVSNLVQAQEDAMFERYENYSYYNF
ncbi:hypothetical protein EBU24_01255 [bacterium]|nr:hypothetical protein [bacterium]